MLFHDIFLSFTFSPFFYRKSGVFPLWEVRLIVLKNFALKGQSWSNGNFFSFTFLCNTLIFLSGHINIWLNFSIYIIFQNHLLKWCELSEGFIRFPLLKRHIEDYTSDVAHKKQLSMFRFLLLACKRAKEITADAVFEVIIKALISKKDCFVRKTCSIDVYGLPTWLVPI